MSRAQFAGISAGACGFLVWTLGLIALIEAASPRAHVGSGWSGALLAVGSMVVGALIGMAATR